jgi:hypothetical protein
MNEELVQQLAASAARLAQAAEALEGVVTRLDAQQETMQNQVAHILAAVEEKGEGQPEEVCGLREQVEELSRANVELRAQAGHLARKTMAPAVSALLSKNGVAVEDGMNREALDKALTSLSVEQRIAVKAEMARAGLIF